MENDWTSISEKLKKEISDTDGAHVIIEALLNEKDDDKSALDEKPHWWKFLSKISSIPVEKLKQKAKKIKEEVEEQDQREVEYCRLLRIAPHPVYTQARPQVISKRYVEGDVSWLSRWIYIDTESLRLKAHLPGLKLKTIEQYVKRGKIKKVNNKLFKRAAFTHSTKEGTIEKYNSDLLQADWP